MRLGIMQPYFLPYIGYFQLISSVDCFVIYDIVKYTKKGWINRNRFLLNGKDSTFTIPLVKDSDFLNVRERRISSIYNREKLLRQLVGTYRSAPEFEYVYPEMALIINYKEDNLFEYVRHSIERICRLLDLKARFIVSSQLPIDHSLRGQDKVLALCKSLGASQYINTIGGMGLYSRERFNDSGIELKFIYSKGIKYRQFGYGFVPNLSIIDILMFNPLDQVKYWVRHEYDLI